MEQKKIDEIFPISENYPEIFFPKNFVTNQKSQLGFCENRPKMLFKWKNTKWYKETPNFDVYCFGGNFKNSQRKTQISQKNEKYNFLK